MRLNRNLTILADSPEIEVGPLSQGKKHAFGYVLFLNSTCGSANSPVCFEPYQSGNACYTHQGRIPQFP